MMRPGQGACEEADKDEVNIEAVLVRQVQGGVGSRWCGVKVVCGIKLQIA